VNPEVSTSGAALGFVYIVLYDAPGQPWRKKSLNSPRSGGRIIWRINREFETLGSKAKYRFLCGKMLLFVEALY